MFESLRRLLLLLSLLLLLLLALCLAVMTMAGCGCRADCRVAGQPVLGPPRHRIPPLAPPPAQSQLPAWPGVFSSVVTPPHSQEQRELTLHQSQQSHTADRVASAREYKGAEGAGGGREGGKWEGREEGGREGSLPVTPGTTCSGLTQLGQPEKR